MVGTNVETDVGVVRKAGLRQTYERKRRILTNSRVPS